jgi:hypothetical protein
MIIKIMITMMRIIIIATLGLKRKNIYRLNLKTRCSGDHVVVSERKEQEDGEEYGTIRSFSIRSVTSPYASHRSKRKILTQECGRYRRHKHLYRIWVGKCEGKGRLQGPWHISESNIEMDFKETVHEYMT